jgi:hypothetical protein
MRIVQIKQLYGKNFKDYVISRINFICIYDIVFTEKF